MSYCIFFTHTTNMLTFLRNWEYKEDFDQIKNVIKLLFPQNRKETVLFFGLFLLFFTFSIFLAINTSVLDNLRFPVDLYFSFDNGMYYTQGFSDLARHPLIKLFTFPILYTGNFFYFLFDNYKARTIFISAICNCGVALSIMYSFRYLRDIISLKGYILYLITFFYASMGMVLILSFTIESFTISLFLLSYITYYYSYCINRNKNVSFLSNLIFAISLGGVTISNFVKGMIFIFFAKEKILKSLKKCMIIGVFFLTILSWMEYKYHFFEDTITAYNSFSQVHNKADSLSNIIFSFFGIPILLPNITTIPFHDRLRIGFEFYNTWWQFAFTIILLIALLASFLRNYKNRLVILLLTLFSVDVFIHCVMKYGINELFIYAGHWIFVIPLLLGWLYKSINIRYQKTLNIILSLLFITLLTNNIYQINNFIKIALQLFPVS